MTVSVMVVDDHPMWREGVARDLQERGFEIVATAGDAPSAVRIAKAVRPNVVLMDLNLGELSGVDATAMITSELPDTRVLVLSASGEHDDVLQAVKAGASGYLVKSASSEELVEAVSRTAMRRRRVHRGPHAAWFWASTGAWPPRRTTRRKNRSSPIGRPRCCGWLPRA